MRWWQNLSPSQLFVGSFLLLISIGTLLLRFAPGLYVGQPMGWLDCLFTSTSAICVTGLVVVDTSSHFTLLGQALLLVMIQLGGLGMLTFTSLIILALGRRLSLRQETLYSGPVEAGPGVSATRLIRDVVKFTFLLEGLGALLLYLLWLPRLGWSGALWPAVFHSVSAFCNAGFSIFSDSLVSAHDSPGILMVCSGLIIAGGLGFLTLEEVNLWWRMESKPARFRLSLQSQIVLATTAFLLVVGAIGFALLEWNGALGSMRWIDRLTNAFFMSATSRTAGFNSIDYSGASDATNFLTILLMTIGGSPGSTAGGMKTTTFFLIGLLAWSRLQGQNEATFWTRSVRHETTSRAVGLFVIGSAVVAAGVMALCISEPTAAGGRTFLALVFEVVSAFNTVGLSLGITAELSGTGKVVGILLMLMGRVGPLTLAAALLLRASKQRAYRYAFEDVIVG